MAGHPYRELEHAKRGPLTASEKLRLGLKGLLKGEPLLEQHRHGLDAGNGLPPQERAKHARKVAASDSVDNIASFIRREPSLHIKRILIEGFEASFRDGYERLHDSACSSESGMSAIEGIRRRDRYLESSLDLAQVLHSEGHMDLDALRGMVRFADGRRR